MDSRDDGEGGRRRYRESRHRLETYEPGASHRKDVGNYSRHPPHHQKNSRHHQRHFEQDLDLLRRLPPEEPKTGLVLQWLEEARQTVERASLTAQKVIVAPEPDSQRHDKHGRHNDVHPRDTRGDSRVRRGASTDSSLLRPAQDTSPLRKRREPLDMMENIWKTAGRNEEPKHKRRRQPSSPSIREAISEYDLSKPEEIFEKRKRHKTKEHRYDVKEKKRKKDDEKEVKKRSKPAKRSDALKATRAAGEDLIRSFKSDKIAQDRLTMRPGTGIFRNGRAASPARKRGISDLAFSEMQFLRPCKHRAPAFEKEVVISKHGQKRMNERERERNDISNYFAPRQPAVPEERSHKERQSPLALSERERNMAPSSDVYGERIGRPHSKHQYERDRREQYLGFGTGLSSPRKFSLPPLPSEPIYTKQKFEEIARSSSPPAPSVTWSVTERSMSRHGKQDVTDQRRERSSSSPSEVRRKLIESGILDGLGRYEPVFDSDTLSRQESLIGRLQVQRSDRSQTRFRLSMRSSSARLNTAPDLERSGAEALRRSQVEAARRALMLEQQENQQDYQLHTASMAEPREVFAGRAYIPKKKSEIPRRPVTTTPLPPRGQRQPAKRSSSLNDISMEQKPIREVNSQSKFDTQQLGVPDSSYSFDLLKQGIPEAPLSYRPQEFTVEEYGYDPSGGQINIPREPSVHMCSLRVTTTGFPTPSTHYCPPECLQYKEMPMYYAQGQLHYQEDLAVLSGVQGCEAKAAMPSPLAHEFVPGEQDFSPLENIALVEVDQIPTGDEYTFRSDYQREFVAESPRKQHGTQSFNYSRNQATTHALVSKFYGDSCGGLQYAPHQQQPQEQPNYAQQNAASTLRSPIMVDEPLWTPKNQKFFQHNNLATWEAGQSKLHRSGLASEQEVITPEVRQNFWKRM